MIEKIRGININVDYRVKKASFTIRKPHKELFSISDKLYGMLQTGFTLTVHLPGTVKILTRRDKYAFKETVKSKFSGYSSWYRYHYKINYAPKGQQELFK